MTLSHGRMQPRRTTRTADGSASPCASSELVLDVTLKLREQAFWLVDLSFDLGKRGLWGIANPHFLHKQPFQLLLLPAKGIDHIDCCLGHALRPVRAKHSIDVNRLTFAQGAPPWALQ